VEELEELELFVVEVESEELVVEVELDVVEVELADRRNLLKW
jgi:hypothetical protein